MIIINFKKRPYRPSVRPSVCVRTNKDFTSYFMYWYMSLIKLDGFKTSCK